MLISLTTLLSALTSIFRSQAALRLENLALRHQIGVLQRSAGKRPRLTPADRLLWVWLSRIWRDWRGPLAIVKPETVIAWRVRRVHDLDQRRRRIRLLPRLRDDHRHVTSRKQSSTRRVRT